MTKIEVEITGLPNSPLMMASPKAMEAAQDGKVTDKRTQREPKIEAEKYAYRLPNSNLYIPSIAIKSAMLKASSFKKIDKKYSLKGYVAAGIAITPEHLDLKTKVYDIDTRSCVLQTVATKPRIVVHRPK